MPLVGHGLGILGLEEPPDVLPVLGVVLRAQVEVKAKLEVLEELAPARASGDELTPGGSELTGDNASTQLLGGSPRSPQPT